ncbi:MAG: DM13 domain-containing protein [Burkholderiales bacterium]
MNEKRKTKTVIILVPILVLVLTAVVWFLASPLFIDQKVEEQFPQAVKSPPSNEAKPVPGKDEIATMSPDELEESKEEILTAAAREPAHEMQEDMPAQAAPTLVAQGKFKDADVIHKGSGDAKLYKLEDESHLLRLENFNVTNGPALHVYLAKHPSPESAADVTDGGYVDLGPLKGNIGNQNYPAPEGTAIGDYKSAVIWCRLFSVLFSPASLQ